MGYLIYTPLWTKNKMKSLTVYSNSKLVENESKALFWIIIFMALLFGIILFFGEKASSQLENIIGSMIAIYGSLYFVNEVVRMHRLKNWKGPLISLTPNGVTDYFYLKEELKWKDIKFVGCVVARNQEEYDYFVIRPLHPTWKYRLKRLFSYPMKYRLERLNIPGSDVPELYEPDNTVTSGSLNKKHITKYLKAYAPKDIWKKSDKDIIKYVPYAILIFMGMIWFTGKFLK